MTVEARHWSPDGSICELCGKAFLNGIHEDEMYDPEGEGGSLLCHTRCGQRAGLVSD